MNNIYNEIKEIEKCLNNTHIPTYKDNLKRYIHLLHEARLLRKDMISIGHNIDSLPFPMYEELPQWIKKRTYKMCFYKLNIADANRMVVS